MILKTGIGLFDIILWPNNYVEVRSKTEKYFLNPFKIYILGEHVMLRTINKLVFR